MSLIIDRRDELDGRPGFHALLVGVGHYPYLSGEKVLSLGGNSGVKLPQLTSAIPTITSIFEWFLQHQHLLSKPLATLRLLLSPLPETPLEGKYAKASSATLDNFRQDVWEWRRDAAAHREGITFFYFIGHGFEIGSGESVIVLQDFGDDIGPALKNTAEVNNLFLGMAPRDAEDTVARGQLFFIDTSRENARRFFHSSQLMNSTPLFDIFLTHRDDRSAIIFYSTAIGARAFARRGQESFFSRALIACLNGRAAEPKDGRWSVSTESLASALQNTLKEFTENLPSSQQCSASVSGQYFSPLIINYLEDAPKVDVIIVIDPPAVGPFARIEVFNDMFELVLTMSPLNTAPCNIELPAGIYSFHVRFMETEFQDVRKTALVLPPKSVLKLEVNK
jgi:hypothetical protein